MDDTHIRELIINIIDRLHPPETEVHECLNRILRVLSINWQEREDKKTISDIDDNEQ